VIHIHNFWFLGLAALFWAKRYGIPVVGTNHFMPENALLNLGASGWLYQRLYHLIWWYLVVLHNRCNFVTSPTETAVKLLHNNGLRAPSQAISNGLDTERFRPHIDAAHIRQRYQLPSDRPLLLYLGRLDGEKRLDVMITALSQLDPDLMYHAVLAGDGIARHALEGQVKRLGLTDRVSFAGFVDEADKPAIYNAAQVFVMPSPAELQSIVTLEAMSCGLPVVAVDVAALHELCHDGHNGYLFPNADSETLAAKLTPLLNDALLRRRFGKASRPIVLEHHQKSVTQQRYTAVYRRLISQRA
jgi:glycosyltransferase involved in cell wall biosynthesis